MQDIQIAQQTVRSTTITVVGGGDSTLTLPPDFRRYSLNVTVSQDAPASLWTYPAIRVYIGGDTTGAKIIHQSLLLPFLITLRDWGNVLSGPLHIRLDGNGADSIMTITELSMINPPNPNTLIKETK